MQSIILQENENFLKKAVALIKDLAQKENETINFIKSSEIYSDDDNLSLKDEAKFKDTLEKYYKGELKFISLDEAKEISKQHLRKLGTNV